MTGRQVTIRSRSPTIASSVMRAGRRKTSTHALVSTSRPRLARTVDSSAFPRDRGRIAAHLGQTADPQPRTGKLVDVVGLGPPNHFLERALDRSGVGALATTIDRALRSEEHTSQ